MIEIHFSGRMGNCLFQYSFGRIIADQLGYSLYIQGNNHATEFPNVENITGRTEFGNPTIEYNDTLQFHIKPKDILNNGRPNHKIVIKGYWQKSEFYINYRDKIKEWCYLPESQHKDQIGEKDIILHIRREDYIDAKSDLNFSYYDTCLSQVDYDRVYIIGPVLDQPVKNYFQKYNPVYLDTGSAIEDFKLMKCFKNIILSNSTFCWMASFVSDEAEKVFYPEPVSGYWSPSQQQKLFISGFHTLIQNVQIGN